MKSVELLIIPFVFLISSLGAAAELPSKLSCVETKSSQVCANNSAICTAPPRSTTLLKEEALSESSEHGTVYRHGRFDVKTSHGLELTAEGTADLGGSNFPLRRVSLFVRETRGTSIRTIKVNGEGSAEFRYSDVKRSKIGHESVDVTITCSLKL